MFRSALTNSEATARQALAAAGFPTKGSLQRASSTNNQVFLSGNNIVRVNANGQGRLQREAELCQALPRLSWTPEIVAEGKVADADYLIVRKKKGSPLSRWWPDMRPSQRRDAIKALAQCLRAIHTTEAPQNLPALDSPPQLLGGVTNPTLPVLHGLRKLRKHRHIENSIVDDLQSKVLALTASVDDYRENRLIHGDLTFENILWDGSQITAVLDFEWSRGGPRDVDLDVLCRFLMLPAAHLPSSLAAKASAKDYTPVVGWLVEDYPELFSHRDLRKRLALYALGYEVRSTLRHPPKSPLNALPELHPYRRLLSVASGGGPAAELVKPVIRPSRSVR